MIPLYRGGWQLTKVRAFMWFALLCGAVAIYWGVDLAQHYGLNPGDGGVLAPLGARLAWGLSVGLFGALFIAALWVYGRCYIARIDYDAATQQLHVFTTGFVGMPHHVVAAHGLIGARMHAGTLNVPVELSVLGASPLSVDALWRSLSVAGWRLPLIFDKQGELLEPQVLEPLFMSQSQPTREGAFDADTSD